jgi:hypothetical protein
VATLAALSLLLGLVTTWAVAWGFAIWEAPGVLTGPTFQFGAMPDGRAYELDQSRGVGVAAARIWAGVASPETKRPIKFSIRVTTLRKWRPGVWAVADVAPVEEVLPPWSATLGAVRSGRLVPSEATTLRVGPQYATVQGNAFILEHVLEEHAAGWPRLCLRSLEDANGDLHHAIVLSESGHLTMSLPLQPVCQGLLVNSLVFASPWLVAFFGFAPARRIMRRRRGRCPRCNYDLRSDLDNGCPECGWGRGRVSLKQEKKTCEDCWSKWP